MTILPIETAPTWQARSAYTVASSTASVGLVTASAGFGAVYAWKTGSAHGYILGALTLLFAIALEISKPLAVQGFFSAARAWAFGQAICLALLATLAVAYSLTAELSLMAAIRSDTIATRQAQTKAAKDHDKEAAARDAERARIDAELAALGKARPVAEMEGLIVNLPKRCKIVVGNGSRQTICTRNTSLDAELGRAKRHEQLEQVLERFAPGRGEALVGGSPSAAGPVAVKDDPAAEALATYMALIGLHVPPATITEWLILVPVLALEVGSALAAVLARTAVHTGSHSSPAGFAKTAMRPDHIEPCDGTATVPPRDPWGGTVPRRPATIKPKQRNLADTTETALLRTLQDHGGTVAGGRRALGRNLGVSATQVNRVLDKLVAAGVVAVEATRQGSVIRLLVSGTA